MEISTTCPGTTVAVSSGPIHMTSPGLSVMYRDMAVMNSSGSKSMSPVGKAAATVPSTRTVVVAASGSAPVTMPGQPAGVDQGLERAVSEH